MDNMNCKLQTYRLPDVTSTKCFRKLYDVFDNATIAVEWLDTILAEVKYQPDMCTYSLIKSVIRAVLDYCVTLEGHKYVSKGRAIALKELALAKYPRL